MTTAQHKRFPNGLHYTNREQRIAFLVSTFGHLLRTSVLDVGCDQQHLKRALPGDVTYRGVDVCEGADVKLDLDKEPLPFGDGSFHTVVCLDVLEHLERIHFMMDELLRVARQHVILSLPNGWFAMKWIPLSDAAITFYGLPTEPPVDRHRWLFNFREAEDFIIAKSQGKAAAVEIYPYFNPTRVLAKTLARVLLPKRRFLNLFCPTIWAVISKQPATRPGPSTA